MFSISNINVTPKHIISIRNYQIVMNTLKQNVIRYGISHFFSRLEYSSTYKTRCNIHGFIQLKFQNFVKT